MSNFFLYIMRAWLKLPFRIAELMFSQNKAKADELVMVQACKVAEQRSEYFISCNMRPKYSDCSLLPPDMRYAADNIAIVLQGPLDEIDSFTVETVKLYFALYEKIVIIVSTWPDANRSVVNELRELGAYIVISEYPENCGYGNINYQLVSTKAGIEKAISLGKRYVCKSRTDQRLYAPGSITYFRDLIDGHFALSGSDFRNRIVCLSAEYAGMFTPFYIPDFLYFGKSEEMKVLFDIPLRPDDIERPENITRKESASVCSEAYIAYSYAKGIDADCELSVKGCLDFLANYMIVVDKSQIGLYWHKYDHRYRDHTRYGTHHVGSSPLRYMNININTFQWEEYSTGTMCLDDSVESYSDERLA